VSQIATTTSAAPLTTTAAEIHAEHEAAQRCASEAIAHAIRCGELLIQTKAALPHGAFGAWLAANAEFSERTAQGYMRLARLNPEMRNAVADLPLRVALRELQLARREVVKARISDALQNRNDSLPQMPRGSRHYRVIRNDGERKWALQALPNQSFPVTETIYFAPLDDASDRRLLTLTAGALIDYFFDHPNRMAVIALHINGDARDWFKAQWFGGRHPWPEAPNATEYPGYGGWTHCGNECGPVLQAAP